MPLYFLSDSKQHIKNDKKELKFIHITKNAGSFIEHIGKENEIKWGKYHAEDGRNRHHVQFSKKPESYRNKYVWFAISRNPYTRILSEYYCYWGGIGYEKINHETIEEFNEFVRMKIETRNENPHWFGHWIEQTKFIHQDNDIYIIKFENLNIELIKLFDLFHINIDPNIYKKQNISDKMGKKFTVEDFDKKTIELINTVYIDDFKTFGYEMKL